MLIKVNELIDLFFIVDSEIESHGGLFSHCPFIEKQVVVKLTAN